MNENDIILDFFEGSGTTAHATMELNKDGGNRKFITIQIPEQIDKNDTEILPINPEGDELSWYWEKDTFNQKIHNLILKKTKNGWQFYRKQRPKIGDLPTKKPKSFFYKSDYSTSTATTKLKDLLEQKVFKAPKPVPFIKDLLSIGMNENDIILDFFAGSGTTAHTTMELNNDGGNRKFITIQIPELINEKQNKIAYDFVKDTLKTEPTIFEITKERITRAAQKMKEENLNYQSNLGFKIFETTPIFDGYLEDETELDEQTTMFDGSSLSDDDLSSLLTTWKAYDGMKLTDALEEITFSNYKAYYGDKKLYFLDKGFTTEDKKVFLEKLDSDVKFEPNKLVLWGYNFQSKHQKELKEALDTYSNKKDIEIDMIVRY